MSFHVTVQGGEDDGRSFRIEGQCVVGRAPGCQARLTDPRVAWEHVALQDGGGRLFAQSLCAAGVRLQDRALTGEERVGHGALLELADGCALRIEERVGSGGRRVRLTLPLLVGAVLVLATIAFAVTGAVREGEPPPAPMTIDHWRTAHQRLVTRMEDWEARGAFPREAIAIFRDAWRLEVAQNLSAAAERWDTMRSLLLTLPMPFDGGGRRTIAEAAGTSAKALDVIMDWAPDTSLSMDPRWSTDEAYCDALSWFVQKRAARAREKMEAGS